MKSQSSSGWRKKVLDRLDESRGILRVEIPADKLEKMYEIAENKDDIYQKTDSDYKEDDKVVTPNERMLTSTSSYLQKCNTKDVPYHYQIVVPEISGSAAANYHQNYEIAVWVRSLIKIFYENNVGAIFFEYCTGTPPLKIDVFPAPTDSTTLLYWKSAFNDTVTELGSLISLNGWTLKHVFPPNKAYISVLLDEGGGLAKIWEGGDQEPREMAIDVVANIWQSSSDEIPPSDLDEKIKAFQEWPS